MNRALALVLLGGLSGCSLFSPKPADVVINEKPVPVVCSNIGQKPDALVLKDTPPTIVLGPGEAWGFWFDPNLYSALAENLQAMRRNMNQQRKIRTYLASCIEDHNATIETTD